MDSRCVSHDTRMKHIRNTKCRRKEHAEVEKALDFTLRIRREGSHSVFNGKKVVLYFIRRIITVSANLQLQREKLVYSHEYNEVISEQGQ